MKLLIFFNLGFFHAFATISLYQDKIGKEAYLANAQETWVDAFITVPIAGAIWIVTLGSLIFWMWRDSKSKKYTMKRKQQS